MSQRNSRLNPGKIRKHARKKFKPLNSLQDHVIENLIERARTQNLVFTRGFVNYILREIDTPDVYESIAEQEANNVLSQLLNVAIEHGWKWSLTVADKAKLKRYYESETNELILLSYSTIVRTLCVFDCPKPWC